MDEKQYSKVYTDEQENKILLEFNRLKGHYYLDHAGATLYSEEQIKRIFFQLSSNLYGNPHTRNVSSKSTEDAIDIVRFEILAHFNTNPDEYSVVFTSGATAALKFIGEYFCYNSTGILAYLQDNHTSVLGMREYANNIKCIRDSSDFGNFLNFINEGNNERNSLFVYPAQSNFSGTKYPLSWIENVKQYKNWFVALDAANYVSTNNLDLSLYKPDFMAISFYKMFGYPTGLGALLIKKSAAYVLQKKYFGGGTVNMALGTEKFMIPKETLHERFEDGTVDFLSIIAVKQGFETMKRLNLNFDLVSRHTFSLAQYVYEHLKIYKHSNGQPLAILYHDTSFESVKKQGGIVNFNLFHANGEFIGYTEVQRFSSLFGVHLRTGCFCNPGACQHFFNLTSEDVKKHFEAGHVCGDENDLINGSPTGSVRISFGYMSTINDANQFLNMIRHCFINKAPERPLQRLKSHENHSINAGITKGVLKQILLYPVKSCAAFSVGYKWQLISTGLKYDREWMIINSSGIAVTQKQNRKLCLIRPTIDLNGKMLKLSFVGRRDVKIPLNITSNKKNTAFLCQSKVCGDKIQGVDCGEEVSEWLVDVLDYPGLRLLRQYNESDEIIGRTSRKNKPLALSLVNKAQFLLINSTSVEWLRNKVIGDELLEPLQNTILRFRPNFVVKFSEPFLENYCKNFTFGRTTFRYEEKCTRCQLICIDQLTGNISKEPLQTLSREFKGKISFGIYINTDEMNRNSYVFAGSEVTGNTLL